MSEAELVIRKHIAGLDEQMESMMCYELDMEDLGYALSQDELVANERKWMQLATRKHELQDILSEILNVDIHALMC